MWGRLHTLGQTIQTCPAVITATAPFLPQFSAAAVYRDVLHGAGVVDVLMTALTDAAVLTDLLLVQVGGGGGGGQPCHLG